MAKKKKKAVEKKAKEGRPTKYKPEFATQVYGIALLGSKDSDLARIFGVSIDTITEWKNVHPEFSASIRRGREEADEAVVKSLYKRATGYEVEEVTIETYSTPSKLPAIPEDGNMEEHVSESLNTIKGEKFKTVKKHIIPDVAAQRFWLMNRHPDKFRGDKIDITSGGEKIHSVPLTPEVIKALADGLEDKT